MTIVSPIKLQRKRTFEKLGACKWAVFCYISACFKFELWPLKRSIALQLYGTDYITRFCLDVSSIAVKIMIAMLKDIIAYSIMLN